jgi:hypothetical protein
MVPPRLYCLVATNASVALVFRRGPSDWFHLSRWRLDDGSVESGAWVRKKLFPSRCDISEDGKLLLYYMSGAWGHGYQVFCGVSRVPWLHPLHSWEEPGTWGMGWCFVNHTAMHVYGEPTQMRLDSSTVTIQRNAVVSLVNERRRGWVEARESPTPSESDPWDEMRNVILEKRCGRTGHLLRLQRVCRTDFDGSSSHELSFQLSLNGDQPRTLQDVVWADWDAGGRLLIATKLGELRIEELHNDKQITIAYHDLRSLSPDPQPAPEWAMQLSD